MNDSKTSDFSLRLAHIKSRILLASQKAGRSPDTIKLIAVSKFHSRDEVLEAMRCGHFVFGENRVQEAKEKFSPLLSSSIESEKKIELHLIGSLQTNKVDDAVRLFDVIQTVDRTSLAKVLAKSIQKVGKAPRLSIEVNCGGEAQKAGVAPEDLSSFLSFCRKECALSISGLMCIPPLGLTPTPFFEKLRKMAQDYDLPHISMGMSQDFEEAIAAGATEIRIGTALFGERKIKRPT